MAVLLGLDPGGVERFGWCVAEYQPSLPLAIRDVGLADYAESAIQAALEKLDQGEEIVAAGVDAPMVWSPAGDRNVDQVLRQEIEDLGAPYPWGTVQAVNSLRGACLAQGMSAALLLQGKYPKMIISESHPKVILWLLGYASPGRPTPRVKLADMGEFRQRELDVSEHERDAAIATLSAWAAVSRPSGWRDLLKEEKGCHSPLDPVAYWMPYPKSYDAQTRAHAQPLYQSNHRIE